MTFRNLHKFVNAAKFNMFMLTEKTQLLISKKSRKSQKDEQSRLEYKNCRALLTLEITKQIP